MGGGVTDLLGWRVWLEGGMLAAVAVLGLIAVRRERRR